MGGGETLIYSLAKYLPRHEWEVSVITGTNQRCIINDGFNLYYLPFFEEFCRGQVGIKPFLEEAYHLIESTHPDILHAFNLYPGYIGSIFAKQHRIPLVFSYFNTPLKNGDVLKMFSNHDVEIALVKHLIGEIHFDYLISISQYFVNHAIQLGISPNRIRWCYPGPDKEIFNSENKNFNLRRKLSIQDDDILVIAPIRIVPRKSVETILFALDLLRDLPIKLLIPSGNIIQPQYENYHQYIIELIHKLKISDKVVFPDQYFHLFELGDLYASADIGVLSSSLEGLGLGALEMIECGVPVIMTKTEGINEISDEMKTPLLFTVDDYHQLAYQIRLLATNLKYRKSASEVAKSEIENKFSLANYIDLHLNTYKQALITNNQNISE